MQPILFLIEYFFIVHELDTWSRDLNFDFTLKDCLFGGVKLVKNAHPNIYTCSGYGIGFHVPSEFSLPDDSVGKNFVIFWVDMSSSVQIDNKKKNILYVILCYQQKLNIQIISQDQIENFV